MNRGGNLRNKGKDDDLYENYHQAGASASIAQSVAKNLGGGMHSQMGVGMGGSGMFGAEPSVAHMGPGGSVDGVARPMTSVKGAGYKGGGGHTASSSGFGSGAGSASDEGPAPPLQLPSANNVERQARDIERAVNTLLEESAAANANKDVELALEKAKEASKRERLLCRHRERNGMKEQINFDLTYAVCFNLANIFAVNGMYTESINTYTMIVKNKQYPQAGRLRVNMGNVYYVQKKYPAAIKMYRMAMDQVGGASKQLKFKIMRNIGNAFVRLGQFQDAIQSYESVMTEAPDVQTGFNLIVCYYALGDRMKMQTGFQQLIAVEDEYGAPDAEIDGDAMDLDELIDGTGAGDSKAKALRQSDGLAKDWKARKAYVHGYIRLAGQLIAPQIGANGDDSDGWDRVVDMLMQPPEPRAGMTMEQQQMQQMQQGQQGQHGLRPLHPEIAMELEIAKGISFLKQKQIGKAIDVFKKFEKQDAQLLDQACINLSFLYFLEGDIESAERYADLAMQADRFNSKAVVNKANVHFQREEYDTARQLYEEAVGLDSDCVEGIYNLGLVYKRLGTHDQALQAFQKLHRMIPKDPQVIYQIANLYDLQGDNIHSAEWFKILHGGLPSDPTVLSRLGTLYNREGDDTQAYHNFSDSYNAYPVNMEVLSWLGVWYIKSELYEQALPFFQRASLIEPDEPKWQLMVATCYRRMGAYPQALAIYETVHRAQPDHLECLKYLVTISKEMHDQQAAENYTKLLRRAERAAELDAESGAGGHTGGMVGSDRGGGDRGGGYMKSEVADSLDDHRGGSGPSKPAFDHNVHLDNTVDQKQKGLAANRGNAVDDDDQWGDDDLGDELLPL